VIVEVGAGAQPEIVERAGGAQPVIVERTAGQPPVPQAGWAYIAIEPLAEQAIKTENRHDGLIAVIAATR